MHKTKREWVSISYEFIVVSFLTTSRDNGNQSKSNRPFMPTIVAIWFKNRLLQYMVRDSSISILSITFEYHIFHPRPNERIESFEEGLFPAQNILRRISFDQRLSKRCLELSPSLSYCVTQSIYS